MQERGLKLTIGLNLQSQYLVAPYAGAWIEIGIGAQERGLQERRSLCRSVD